MAAIGDASNLQGGLLVLTTLRGINGQIYGTAQGPVVTGGFVAGRGAANQQTVNHPTVGRVPTGVTVEHLAPSTSIGSVVKLQLKDADFTTAARIADTLNRHFAGTGVAHAENSGLVTVNVPPQFSSRSIEFISELERLSVQPDQMARVVVNERTGTVVLGKDVRISPVAIMHGNLTVEVQTTYTATEPVPFSNQPPVVVPADFRDCSGREIEEPHAPGRRNGRRSREGPGLNRIHNARCDRHPPESARRRRSGS